MEEKRKLEFKVVWAKCPYCGKIIERIGVEQIDKPLGYIGVNCPFCQKFEEANLEKIEYIQKGLFSDTPQKTRVWRK